LIQRAAMLAALVVVAPPTLHGKPVQSTRSNVVKPVTPPLTLLRSKHPTAAQRVMPGLA